MTADIHRKYIQKKLHHILTDLTNLILDEKPDSPAHYMLE